MAVISLASVAGSPGVTTTAVGLALYWPHPVIVVEADSSRPSAIVPGFLQASVDASRSLLHLAGTTAQDSDLWDQLVPLYQSYEDLPASPRRYVLPGISTPAAAAGMRTLWTTLPPLLRSMHTIGVDVIIDLGRLSHADPRAELVVASDLVVLCTHTTLPALAALSTSTAWLTQRLNAAGRTDQLGLITTASAGLGYPDRQITAHTGHPVLGHLPWDPLAAAVFSDGAPAPRRWRRGPLPAAVRTLARSLAQTAHDTAAELSPTAGPERPEET